MNKDLHDTFLSLIRLGIGRKESFVPCNVDWEDIETIANQHSLLAIVVDGIE